MVVQLEKIYQTSSSLSDSNTKINTNYIKPNCINLRTFLKLEKNPTPIIIGIAGDSGSGKTTYSQCLKRLIGEDLVASIEMDGYHKEDRAQRKISKRLPLDPDANHLDLLEEHLACLKEKREINVPIYNHHTGCFDAPKPFKPKPIIIIEGLHALYSQFTPYLDLGIFVNPAYQLKWKWKYDRDVHQRGHAPEALEQEMLKREAAYKQWIDFQKINAPIVVNLFESQLCHFAQPRFICNLPDNCYKIELIIEPANHPLPTLPLPFDLSDMLTVNDNPFMLTVAPSTYWGRKCVHIHLDGVFSQTTIYHLEKQITYLTGTPFEEIKSYKNDCPTGACKLSELLVTWRFLELVNHQIHNYFLQQ